MTSALKLFQGRFGRVALLDSDHNLVAHAHPHCHVLIKADGEDTSYQVGRRLHRLTHDTLVLVNAWEPHAKLHDDARGRSTVLALYIEPAWLAEMDGKFGVAGLRGFFPEPCVALPPDVRLLADRLIGEMTNATGQRGLEDALLELMMAVIFAFSAWREASDIQRADLRRQSDPRIARAIRFMRQNLGGFSFEEVARQSHLSRPHFFYLFKQCTALSPALFLNALRMEAAFGQLATPGTAINSVADRLGFSEPHHFTRFFRHNLGIPPSEYRKTVELFQ
jgi:AraC-like DNA-binding protein